MNLPIKKIKIGNRTLYALGIGGLIVSFTGIVLLAFLVYVDGHTLPQEIPGEPQVPLALNGASALSTTTPSVQQKAPSVQNVPRLVISKIGVDIPIVEGKNEKVLLRGAWRSPWSSTPDKGSNTVLFGHRYLHKPPNPETFFNLDKVAVGDTFTISWTGKTYTYRVYETKVVPPTDISVLAGTNKSIVTLITCTPLYTTKNRLIIKAELVS